MSSSDFQLRLQPELNVSETAVQVPNTRMHFVCAKHTVNASITHTPCGSQLASLAARAHLISSQCLRLQFGCMAKTGGGGTQRGCRWREVEWDSGKWVRFGAQFTALHIAASCVFLQCSAVLIPLEDACLLSPYLVAVCFVSTVLLN